MIHFDSFSEEFKSPLGAIKQNSPVTFTVKVKSMLGIEYVNLVIRADGEQKKVLKKTDTQQGLDFFSGIVMFDSVGLYHYRFELVEKDGTMHFCGTHDGHRATLGDFLPEWYIAVYDKNFHTSKDLDGAVMYQIFPDRFYNSDKANTHTPVNERITHASWNERPYCCFDYADFKCNDYFMGNLKGIEQKLDHLVLLGVTHLYLNPIFESAENHRYSTSDYMQIDSYLGDTKDFESLCKAAKKKGIKIILDGVFSHTGDDSIYFNKYNHYDSVGAYNSKESPYYDWYTFKNYPDDYECWWGFKTLPNTKETSPEFMNFITGEGGVLEYWLKKGASGWRLDVADELPDEFLEKVRQRVKKFDKHALIIGEVWENAITKISYGARRKFLLGSQCDSVMNYPFLNAIIDFIKTGKAYALYESVMDIVANYPPESVACLMNSLSTHDTARALSLLGCERVPERRFQADAVLSDAQRRIGIKRLMLATVLQFTLPGIPCIFYGDEAGVEGFGDPACRKPYPWGREEPELLEHYQKLGKMRTEFSKDFAKPIEFLQYSDGVVSYKRGSITVTVTTDTAVVERGGNQLIFVN